MSRADGARYAVSDWTDERTERLKKLWTDGLSAGQIAKDLGSVTRNAIIGKVNRLGLSGRKTPAMPRGARAQPTTRRLGKPRSMAGLKLAGNSSIFAEPDIARAPRVEVPVAAFEPLPGSSPRPWMERLSGMCCWPVGGDGADMLSCCLPVFGRGWCAGHFRRGAQPASVKTRVDLRVGKDVARAVA